MDERLKRAYAAYFRFPGRADAILDQPDESLSGVKKYKKRLYVVLRNVEGTLAVYRVRNDGMLRRMKRWPKEIDQ